MNKSWGRSLPAGCLCAAAVIFFGVSTSGNAEIHLSILAGPSFSLKQNVKARTFDSTGKVARRELLSSESSLRFKTGAKISYFFHKNVGIETEFFYGQTFSQVDLSGTRFSNVEMVQKRSAFILSFVFRGKLGRTGLSSLYGGLGYGAVYSDIDLIGQEWGKGGQLFAGMNFPINDRYTFFLESKYFWAPDVGNVNRSVGEHLKVSGSPKYNLAHKIFGPHEDTQVIGLLLGLRFKIKD